MAGIYIHIPFCRQACSYCNFHFSVSTSRKNEFKNALLKEIELSKDYLSGDKIETIYFGGGTPSILDINELKEIFASLQNLYAFDDLKEITLEANPDDLTNKYLDGLLATPINRLSIGIQSFDDEELKLMNRSHDSKIAEKAVRRSKQAGFENINVDLIFGIPGSSDDILKDSMEKILSLGTPHISAYALTIEARTVLYHQIKKGIIKLSDDDQYERQMALVMSYLKEQGYVQYEISNFALNGHIALHNTNYWLGKRYLGLGPSAHSFNGVSRRWNINNNTAYCRDILKENVIPHKEEILTENDKYNEFIMTSMRTMWGVKIDDIIDKFGHKYEQYLKANIASLVNKNFIELKNGIYTIPDDKKIISDNLISQLFLIEHH